MSVSDRPRILVVDDSRIVRASLAAHLKAHYDIREEADGESAWQTLVLDQTVQLVISDLQMPKLDGYGLLERVRSSRLRRLQEMPFILVSGEETEEERQKAKSLGVSEFITKGAGTAEILTRVEHLLALSRTREHLEAGREHMVQDAATGLFTRKYVELQAAQALSHAARYDTPVSVLVLGLDAYDDICGKLGGEVAAQVGTRFARMLATKIRQGDSLGHFETTQYAIVSPGTPPAQCGLFAERVRQAVEVANVVAQGKRVELTVSVGVASVPADHVASAGALLELAGARMREAMQAGGNRVVLCEHGGMPVRPPGLQHALELLRAGRTESVRPHLPALGEQVLPLLELMDKEFGLGLPVGEIGSLLKERARRGPQG